MPQWSAANKIFSEINKQVTPMNATSKDKLPKKFFYETDPEVFRLMREKHPVVKSRIGIFPIYVFSRYQDCRDLLNEPELIRNRANIPGKKQFPFPVPAYIKSLANGMINLDDPAHQRLRNLVRQAFKPQTIKILEEQIETYCDRLLEDLPQGIPFDFQKTYALQLPVQMISLMMGLNEKDANQFASGISVLTDGLTGWNLLKSMTWDLPRLVGSTKKLIERKKMNLGEDILSGILTAREGNDVLTDDEVLAMVFLLIIAGFETTVHLLTNGLMCMFKHPESMETLRQNPEHTPNAVEEILRFAGPVMATKPNYFIKDKVIEGVKIPKGAMVFPWLAAANRDPDAFDDPDTFDIFRTPNHHLSFGYGKHFCLGAHLARSEARIGFSKFLSAFSQIEPAKEPKEITYGKNIGWRKYQGMPVVVRA